MSSVVAQPLLTINDLSERLKISPRTLYRHIDNGTVPAPIKVGGAVRWKPDVIDQWIEDGCQPVSKNRR